MRFTIARAAAAASSEDRVTVLPTEDGLVVALADGAGGLGNGGRAAQAWIDTVIGSPSPPTWAGLLEKIDESTARRGPGQTTAIALSIAEDITGVCVG